MWLRWLMLWGTFGISIGLGLGLTLLATPLGLAAGSRPQSLILDRLGRAALLVPLEWAAVLLVLLSLVILAVTGRGNRNWPPASLLRRRRARALR